MVRGKVTRMSRLLPAVGSAGTTPLLRSPELDAIAGRPVHLKYEGAQPGGSFKWRAVAYYVALRFDPARETGLVTYSSGNQGIALATLARTLRVPSMVVVPHDVAPAKERALAALNATVVRYERGREDRRLIASRIAQENRLLLVPSSDSQETVDGNHALADELHAVTYEELYAPVGGGGLLAALAGRAPMSARVFGVESAEYDKFARALAGAAPPPVPQTTGLTDALRAAAPSPLALRAARARGVTMLTAADDELVAARALFERLFDRRAEYSAVAGLAALLRRRGGGTAVAVVTGSNADDA